ncbi:MAG: hypothetical protein U1E73_03805 [Planctomycetota bacterium]
MTPFEALVHRVNNLLSTIDLQSEVARAEGSLAAHVEALAHITESAARTRAELELLKRRAREATQDG